MMKLLIDALPLLVKAQTLRQVSQLVEPLFLISSVRMGRSLHLYFLWVTGKGEKSKVLKQKAVSLTEFSYTKFGAGSNDNGTSF